MTAQQHVEMEQDTETEPVLVLIVKIDFRLLNIKIVIWLAVQVIKYNTPVHPDFIILSL